MELGIAFKANERFAEVNEYRLLSPFSANVWSSDKRKVFFTGDALVMLDKTNADGSTAAYGRKKFLLNVYKKIDVSALHKTSTTTEFVQKAIDNGRSYAPVQAGYDTERDYGHDLNKHEEHVTIYDKAYYERLTIQSENGKQIWKSSGTIEKNETLKVEERYRNFKWQPWPLIDTPTFRKICGIHDGVKIFAGKKESQSTLSNIFCYISPTKWETHSSYGFTFSCKFQTSDINWDWDESEFFLNVSAHAYANRKCITTFPVKTLGTELDKNVRGNDYPKVFYILVHVNKKLTDDNIDTIVVKINFKNPTNFVNTYFYPGYVFSGMTQSDYDNANLTTDFHFPGTYHTKSVVYQNYMHERNVNFGYGTYFPDADIEEKWYARLPYSPLEYTITLIDSTQKKMKFLFEESVDGIVTSTKDMVPKINGDDAAKQYLLFEKIPFGSISWSEDTKSYIFKNNLEQLPFFFLKKKKEAIENMIFEIVKDQTDDDGATTWATKNGQLKLHINLSY